ncbi:MAG: N-acetyltransferase family protein [Burkholderiales bacterium]|nr:MAG: N-acetyltransferase family protein [Betaproteobacteria bacterium]TAG83795.1 MAG: N-acetyltransferase family protein [Burkholderiales bacterium]
MTLVSCAYDAHAAAILAIFNDAIANSTALYEYKPRTMETMKAWFATKEANRFPVIGAVDDRGALMGFASYGNFRAFPANKYTVEHSVYVEKSHRGKGVSLVLMEAIIQKARAANLHTLIGGIDATNEVSIAVHKKMGFEHAGTIRHAAFKFGRWLDLAFYQLILETPLAPVDG